MPPARPVGDGHLQRPASAASAAARVHPAKRGSVAASSPDAASAASAPSRCSVLPVSAAYVSSAPASAAWPEGSALSPWDRGRSEQGLGVVSSVVEAAVRRREPGPGDVEQLSSGRQPARLAGGLVQGEESLGEVAVVVEDARGAADRPAAGGATQPAVDEVLAQHEVRAGPRRLDQRRRSEQRPSLAEAGDGQAVPGGDHLVVTRRLGPGGPGLEQPRSHPVPPGRVLRVAAELEGGGAVLEGPTVGDAQQLRRSGAVDRSEHLAELGRVQA